MIPDVTIPDVASSDVAISACKQFLAIVNYRMYSKNKKYFTLDLSLRVSVFYIRNVSSASNFSVSKHFLFVFIIAYVSVLIVLVKSVTELNYNKIYASYYLELINDTRMLTNNSVYQYL